MKPYNFGPPLKTSVDAVYARVCNHAEGYCRFAKADGVVAKIPSKNELIGVIRTFLNLPMYQGEKWELARNEAHKALTMLEFEK